MHASLLNVSAPSPYLIFFEKTPSPPEFSTVTHDAYRTRRLMILPSTSGLFLAISSPDAEIEYRVMTSLLSVMTAFLSNDFVLMHRSARLRPFCQ